MEGARIVTAHPTAFMREGEVATMATLEARSRANGEIIVGFIDRNLQAHIVVEKAAPLAFADVESLIVMTTSNE